MGRLIGGLFLLLPATLVSAHHSVTAYFDTTRMIEIRGELLEVKWRNPHVSFKLRVMHESGQYDIWDISTTSLSHLSRFGLSAEMFTVGDSVVVAGSPSRQAVSALQATNMLLPGDREIVLNAAGARYWSEGSEERLTIAEIDARTYDSAQDASLFRVWSTLTYDRDQDRLWETTYPLTDSARVARAEWDPLTDNPIISCMQKGLPGVMNPPYPMELIDYGSVIVYRQEELDSVRIIYMNSAATPDPQPSTMGHSIGYWDDRTLVVRTTHSTWSLFDGTGIPLSPSATFEERFSVSDDGSRLNYTILTTDPETFTEPVLLDRFWIWIPDAEVRQYDCAPN